MSGCPGREDRAELLAEEALAGEPREERPDGAAQDPLAERRAGGVLDHRAVEQQGAGDSISSAPSRSRAISSVATEVPMSWATKKTGPRSPLAADQLLDQVGLPVQRVVVVARLLGEAEAEEVGGEGRVLGLQLEQQPPVVGAGREAVQEEQQRLAPPRSKRWMRRPRNSSSAPRSRQAATRVVRPSAAIALWSFLYLYLTVQEGHRVELFRCRRACAVGDDRPVQTPARAAPP